MWKQIVALTTLLAFAGCTTLQAIPDVRPTSVQQNVQLGDRVRIEARDGRTYELKVDEVSADALYGTAAGGKRYRIPYASIAALEKHTVAGSSVLWAVLGIAAVIALIAALGGGGGNGGGSGY